MYIFFTFTLPFLWNGLENNLLIPNWLHTSFNTLFLNDVSLLHNIARLPSLWPSMQDKEACTTFSADFFFMGLQTCKTCIDKLLLKVICYLWNILVSNLWYPLPTLPLGFAVLLDVVVDTLPC